MSMSRKEIRLRLMNVWDVWDVYTNDELRKDRLLAKKVR